ncbi:MAG: cytochrome P450 [Acidobacteria bacterium]|nr:cytochrome P450 [Acidobacteriota bacterium]
MSAQPQYSEERAKQGTKQRARQSAEPPGPKPLPLLGSLPELRRNPMEFYARLARDYGGFSRFYYGRKPTFLAASPESIKELLVDKREIYVKNTRYAAIRRAIGNGLLNSEGETWKKQRRCTQNILNRKAIRDQVAEAAEVIAPELERWQSAAKSGTAIDIEPDLTRMVQLLIGQWVLGSQYARYGGQVTELVAAVRQAWPEPPRSIWASLKPPPLLRLRKLESLLEKLDEVVYAAIRGQRESGSVDFSLLSGLARAGVEEGQGFSDAELRDQLLTAYHAGFETSASNLTFLFYELYHHPEIRQRLHREVDDVLGSRLPESGDITKLEYARCCLSETLRLYPPAYNFTRVALEENTLSGYAVPKGSMVIVSPYATHRIEELFPDPLTFDPERFRPEAVEGRSQFAYIPFGAGHRFCVGQGLAEVQTKVIASMICQRFELDCVSDRPLETQAGTVMRPRGGMPMLVRARHPASAPISSSAASAAAPDTESA